MIGALELGSGYRVRVSGSDSAVRFAHVLTQPVLSFLKLVELVCSLCEWVVSKPWWLWSGLATGCRGFDSGCSFLAARLNQLRKRRGAHVLTQPALMGATQPLRSASWMALLGGDCVAFAPRNRSSCIFTYAGNSRSSPWR